jgi:hypothetical protein
LQKIFTPSPPVVTVDQLLKDPFFAGVKITDDMQAPREVRFQWLTTNLASPVNVVTAVVVVGGGGGGGGECLQACQLDKKQKTLLKRARENVKKMIERSCGVGGASPTGEDEAESPEDPPPVAIEGTLLTTSPCLGSPSRPASHRPLTLVSALFSRHEVAPETRAAGERDEGAGPGVRRGTYQRGQPQRPTQPREPEEGRPPLQDDTEEDQEEVPTKQQQQQQQQQHYRCCCTRLGLETANGETHVANHCWRRTMQVERDPNLDSAKSATISGLVSPRQERQMESKSPATAVKRPQRTTSSFSVMSASNPAVQTRAAPAPPPAPAAPAAPPPPPPSVSLPPAQAGRNALLDSIRDPSNGLKRLKKAT